MTTKSLTAGVLCTAASVLALAAGPRAFGQATPPPAAAADNEELVVLSPFVVSADEDAGSYSARNTLAGTRIRTELRDVGSSISVVTQKFMQDTNSKSASDLLVYTTGTEVSGQGGNFLGQGDGQVLISQQVNRPVQNTRVRGLAAADNTRDFFLSDIPWDSYNVGRIDLQRGPNAILFGIGSPAGIVNASLNAAAFKNSRRIENQIGSFGSFRTSADFNQVLIKNQLAVRVALLDDQTKYRQDPTYKDDQRVYGALRFDPARLNQGSAHTSFTANFEKGRQYRLDPIDTPPLDYITPWFYAYSPEQRAVGFSAANPALFSPGTDLSNPLVRRYGIYTGNYQGQRPQGLATTDPWLGPPAGRVFDGLVTVYNGASPDFTYAAQSRKWPDTGAPNLVNTLGTNNVLGIAPYGSGLNTYANNANLPYADIAAYRPRSLTDPSLFDFYNNLLGGPNAQQFNRFYSVNLTARQTFLDEKVGFELAYDKQHARFGNYSLLANNAMGVAIDIMRTFHDGSPNPNFQRPVVYAGGGSAGGSWDRSDREVFRATGYGELNFSELAGRDSLVGRLLGRNTFTGLYAEQKVHDFRTTYLRYYTSDAFAPTAANAAVGQATRDINFAVYLGGPITGNTASGAHLTGIKNVIKPPQGQSVTYYNNVAGAFQQVPVTLVNNDDAADEQKTYSSGRKSKDVVTSTAAVWQGYWLQGTVIPMFGYREDRDTYRDAGDAPSAPRNQFGFGGSVLPFDPSWRVPENPTAENTVRSKTYSLVTHLPEKWRQQLPGRLDVSLTFSKSENFNPDSSRRDIMGGTIANPAGKTREYGVAVSALDERLTFKWAHYRTEVSNATLDSNGLGNQYLIGAVEAWGQQSAVMFRDSLAAGGPLRDRAGTLYGHSSDGHQVTWQPDGPLLSQNADSTYPYTQAQLDAAYARERAAVDDWFAHPAPAALIAAWGMSDYATGGGTWRQPNGLVIAGDTISQGNEFELIANPVKGLNITVSAAKTSASRQNLARSYVDWILQRAEDFEGPMGDMRLWGPADDNQSVNGRASGHNGETARGKFGRETLSNLLLFNALEGSDVPELRPWRFNVVANYDVQNIEVLKGVNVGGSYRWQQRNTLGYPVIGAGTVTDPHRYDVSHPYKGSDEGIVDCWIGYSRKLDWHGVNWRVQLNIRNLLATDHLSRVTVQPDGSPAAWRIPEPRTFTLTNTFEF